MLVRFTLSTAILLVAAALFTLGGGRASAGLDLSGTWDASYSLTCSATFEESGSDVSATVQCGSGAEGTLTGSLGMPDGAFMLSGSLGLLPVSLEGTVTGDLTTMEGTLSAPPLVPSGSFTGQRDSGGPSYNTTGDWTITFTDIFAGACAVEIVHNASDLAATLDCENIVASPLEGTFDGETIVLSGPFSTFTELIIEAEVSDDGGSVDGTWTVDPGGLTGSFTAIRRGGPPAEPTSTPRDVDDDDDEEATPTEAVGGLPDTGTGGAGGAGALPWVIAGLAGVGVLCGAAFAASRRVRSEA